MIIVAATMSTSKTTEMAAARPKRSEPKAVETACITGKSNPPPAPPWPSTKPDLDNSQGRSKNLESAQQRVDRDDEGDRRQLRQDDKHDFLKSVCAVDTRRLNSVARNSLQPSVEQHRVETRAAPRLDNDLGRGS